MSLNPDGNIAGWPGRAYVTDAATCMALATGPASSASPPSPLVDSLFNLGVCANQPKSSNAIMRRSNNLDTGFGNLPFFTAPYRNVGTTASGTSESAIDGLRERLVQSAALLNIGASGLLAPLMSLDLPPEYAQSPSYRSKPSLAPWAAWDGVATQSITWGNAGKVSSVPPSDGTTFRTADLQGIAPVSPPFAFADSSGKPVGYAVDVLNCIGQALSRAQPSGAGGQHQDVFHPVC